LPVVIATGGCQRTVAPQGQRGASAYWSAPTLSAVIDDTISAQDVAAAAEAALLGLGYSIAERSATGERATVTGLAPGGTRFDRVVVRAEPQVRQTRILVTTRLTASEDRARIVLDEILVYLGR
jgi:hypothetical protein